MNAAKSGRPHLHTHEIERVRSHWADILAVLTLRPELSHAASGFDTDISESPEWCGEHEKRSSRKHSKG